MEFGLLGPMEVMTGGDPVPLGAPKQRALLALFLLNPNRVLARERLIDELWGDRPPETAAKAVQVYRERLRGQLMLALYRAGRQAEALEAYQQARAALDELGMEPGAALRQLEKQILTQAPALELGRDRAAIGPVVLPGPLLPTPSFPFVGRAAELASLRSLLERAAGGEGAFVLIASEAGAGKTRLVRELAHAAAAGDGVIALYGASDAVVRTPYQPLREWLEYLLRVWDPETLAECLRGPPRAASPRRRGARTRPRSRPGPGRAGARPPLHPRRSHRRGRACGRLQPARRRAALAAAAFDQAAEKLSTALELGIADPRERARTEVELGFLLNEMGCPLPSRH